MNMEKYKLDCSPICKPQSIIKDKKYRITVLSESLIRLEYSKDGKFEDRATQTVMNRDFPEVKFDIKETDGDLVLYTSYLELHYNKRKFSKNGLYIKVKETRKVWHYTDEPKDLKGTARTLDKTNGEVELERGVISKDGYSIIDDSKTMILTDDGWIEPRNSDMTDIYFFGYGHRYRECLKDFYYLCGKTPLLPRYALGNWWSRYHKYTQDEYENLIESFEKEKLPFTVAVIDMDWHLVDDVDKKYGNGWTGYTWNRKLFPNHVEFLKWLHEHGFKVSLNVHPADGIRAYEEPYKRVATAMGLDPREEKTVEFDPTNPHFIKIYFDQLHHPLEEDGVDFWWIDWQQGTKTKIEGLDPLWMLNHYHYLDSSWKGKRPMTFSRYAGVGSHRYPIGFSGDTVITWKSLDFQPYFTSTASNIGYGWWSHDIGGHMLGSRDDELTARWFQYGVFSPINRLHSSNNPFCGKEPWKYNNNVKEPMERYLRLRHKLIPYLYTMNRRANKEDLPLILPMYYYEPEKAEAYRVPNEYYFGTEMIVSPITKPIGKVSQSSKTKTWLPDGLWADFFNGQIYKGGRMIDLYRGIEDIPVLMKAGAIVPMSNEAEGDNSVDNPKNLEIHIFPADNGEFTLYEDDGDSPYDANENWASTKLSFVKGAKPTFKIDAAKGNLSVIPDCRSWKLVFTATSFTKPQVYADGKKIQYNVDYNNNTQSMIVEISNVNVKSKIEVVFSDGLKFAEENITQRCYNILEKAQMDYKLKADAYREIRRIGKQSVGFLKTLGLNSGVLGALIEVLTAI